jgi:hypothetical protein
MISYYRKKRVHEILKGADTRLMARLYKAEGMDPSRESSGTEAGEADQRKRRRGKVS